jgi:hypothetical protein
MPGQSSGLPQDSLLRVARASHHIQVLERGLRTFYSPERDRQKKPYRLVREPHPGSRDDLVFVEQLRPTPERFALLASDAIHSLRAALDNLAFALAGSPKRDRSAIAFPIESVDPDVSPEARRTYDLCVVGISTPAKAVIESVQPYHRPDNWNRQGKYIADEWNYLAILRMLSNADKHRALPTFLFSSEGYVISDNRPIHTPSMGSLKGKTPIARVTAGTPSDYDMEVDFHPLVSIAIDSRGAAKASVDALLRMIRSHIEMDVFPKFEPFFQDGKLIRP